MSRVTFKTVLKDLKETNTQFVIAGGGDGKIGFNLYNESGPVDGAAFTTKNIGIIPNKIVETVKQAVPDSPFSLRYPDGAGEPSPEEPQKEAA